MTSFTSNTSQLLTKISCLKSSSNNNSKQLKLLDQQLLFYQTYSLSLIQTCQQKLQQINSQLNQCKKNYQQNQTDVVNKLEIFQNRLKNILEEYQSQRKKGEKMISQMIQNVQIMFDQILMKRKRNHNQEVQNMLKLSQRVQNVVKTLNHMNFSLKQRYSNLKKKIKDKMNILVQNISIEIEQIDIKKNRFLKDLELFQKKLDSELNLINQLKQQKRLHFHQIIQNFISELTNE